MEYLLFPYVLKSLCIALFVCLTVLLEYLNLYAIFISTSQKLHLSCQQFAYCFYSPILPIIFLQNLCDTNFWQVPIIGISEVFAYIYRLSGHVMGCYAV